VIPAFGPFLARRYLLTRPIMLLGIFGVLFAVWAILVVDGVFSGFVREIRTDVARSSPDLLLTDLPHDTGYDTLRDVLEADADVAATAPRLRHHGLLQNRRARSSDVESAAVDFNETTMLSGFALLLGIDPLREAKVTRMPEWFDRAPSAIEAHYNRSVPRSTVLDQASPERLARLFVENEAEWRGRGRAGLPQPPGKEAYLSQWPGVLLGWRRFPYQRFEVGDPVELLVAPLLPDAKGALRVSTGNTRLAFAGWYATGHRLFDETQALLPIETLRTLLGNDITEEASIALVTDVAIRLRDSLPAEAIAACQQRLQAAAQAVLPNGSAPCNVLDWNEQNSVFLGAVAQEHKMMQFVLFVVMLVAAFTIYATLHMMVVQKWKDIGILAAIGGSPQGIGMVFVTCGFVVGATGAACGAAFGLLSVYYLNDIDGWLLRTVGFELFPKRLFDLPRIPVHLEAGWAIQVALGALCLAVIVALVPARKAARMNPVQALSYE